ncbi:hypothetical protein AB6A40_008071 [Gnathostoma spinigerum]|uniref:Uncharacterized protein n=1 Tax=Gnathostoma spinigerum TaxID=75299 RepID=A0ABD6EXF2_9BILA
MEISSDVWKLGQVNKASTGTSDVIRFAEVRPASRRTLVCSTLLLYPLEVGNNIGTRARLLPCGRQEKRRKRSEFRHKNAASPEAWSNASNKHAGQRCRHIDTIRTSTRDSPHSDCTDYRE